MNVGIVGSRAFPTPALIQVANYLKTLNEQDVIITGGAIGVDLMAEIYAREQFGLKVIVHLPNWGRYGREAGKVRNVLIVREADLVVAFWDGRSSGTFHDMTLAQQFGKPLEIHFANGTIHRHNTPEKGLF